ncbi:MAG: class I SAM-dependent methyltransferase [Chthoniobacterales bacterium]
MHRFVGQSVHFLEVGIYSGGSLQMWSDYFGSEAHIYGVDIEEACRAYENEKTTIFIGDQADRNLWRRIKHEIPLIDVVLDDGGHLPEQQIATFEEMLPHLRPGGVYICEDIHGINNRFAAYLQGLSSQLNSGELHRRANKELSVEPSSFQSSINGIHLYPFVAVVELNTTRVETIEARRHGTHWQPFF